MIQALEQRIEEKQRLTKAEIALVKLLVKTHLSGYTLAIKKTKEPKAILWSRSKFPNNPLTGYQYENDVSDFLMETMKQNPEWCGQFAGEKQWAKLGRRIGTAMPTPVYSYDAYGRTVGLYAIEQTEPLGNVNSL